MKSEEAKFLDRGIEKGIIFLLIFTPLAFGTVQQWAISVMEIASFSILCLLLFKQGLVLTAGRSLTPVFIMFAALTCLIIFQMLPLPEGLLQVLSPSALSFYKDFSNYYGGASHTLSVNPYATGQELLKLLSYGAVFFVIVSHYRTKEKLNSLVRTIFYMSCFLVVFAVVQKLTWNGRVFWFYPLEATLRSGSGIWGPYINHNHFAGYMEMTIPLGLGLLIYLAPYVKTLPGVPFRKNVARFLANDNLVSFLVTLIAVFFMTAALVMTMSRGGMIALGISSLFFVWLTRKRRSLRSRSRLVGLLAIVAVIVVGIGAFDLIAERFKLMDPQGYTGGRLMLWEDALGIVRDFPLFGSGLGTFENTFMRYQTFGLNVLFDHAHNDYLEVLTDIGVPGFLIAAGMVSFFFLSIYRRWRMKRSMFGKCVGAGGLASCFAISVHSFTDFNLHIPANALLFTVIAGITHAAVFNLKERNGRQEMDSRVRGNDREKKIAGSVNETTITAMTGDSYRASGTPGSLTGRRRFLIISGTIILAFILLYFPVRELIADHYYRGIKNTLDDKTTEGLDVRAISEGAMPAYIEALRSLDIAHRISPSRALYLKASSELYTRLGLWAGAMESLNFPFPSGAVSKKEDFDKALAHLQKAVSLEPTNPDYHLALGQLYNIVQGPDESCSDAEIMKALKAFPHNAPLRYSAAMHFLLAGKKGDALEQAGVLAKIDDSYIIPESSQKIYMRERRTDEYLSVLYGSYLFRALEIAWRASGDPQAVAGIAPDTSDAKEVVNAFMEWKGIE